MSEKNVLTLELTPISAQKLLIEIISSNSGKVKFTTHCEEKMTSRKITRTQVCCVLKHGRFIEGPYRSANRNWEMKVEGLTAGDFIRVVCAIDNDSTGNHIIVITTF